MIAISATGRHVYAWVENPSRPRVPRLFVTTDSVSRHEIHDPAGVPGTDPEAPPKIGFDPQGNIYLAYQVTKVSEPRQGWNALHVIRSSNDGLTWSKASNTADDGPWGEYRSDDAFHISPDGTLNTAWIDSRDPTQQHIYFAHSSDKGSTWSKNTPVDLDAPCDCCRTAIASSANGTLYLAWRKKLAGGVRDIVVAHSADRGVTWSHPIRAYADEWKISSCPDAGPALLADADGRLHLAWWTGKEGAAGVKFVSSLDGGSTWGRPIVLKEARFSTASHVQLTRADADTLLVVWDDGTLETPSILLEASHDNGESFGMPLVLSESGVRASDPVVAATGRTWVIAWNQESATATGQSRVDLRTVTW